jgi:holliday junction DNA helicase RuvB
MEIIGNNKLKAIIEQMKEQLPLPHILLYGPSGTGKSTIAKWIAETCDTKYAIFYASNLDDFMLKFIINDVPPNTVVIIDEIHALPKKLMEILYQPMEEFILFDRNINPFTLVGATTELYKIPEPFFRRFIIPYRIPLYTSDEIYQFIKSYSKKEISDDICNKVAAMCKGNMGYARNYMEILFRISNGSITIDDIQELMEVKNIDEHGFDMEDWMYLSALSKYEILGVQTISSLIGEGTQTIESKIEPYLLQSGLIIKTGKGRRLSPAGNIFMRESSR